MGQTGARQGAPLNKVLKAILPWIIILGAAILLLQLFAGPSGGDEIDYTLFYRELEAGNVKSVVITDSELHGVLKTSIENPAQKGHTFTEFTTSVAAVDIDFLNKLAERGVTVSVDQSQGTFLSILFTLGPVVLIVVLFVFMMRRMQGAGSQAMSFAKSRARLVNQSKNKTTFDDVAGCDEAKEELVEIISFLKSPKKFQKLGGKIPRGVLLVGPPGTGKTLLARAVAGEANVPFFSISGSDFVEMFVGVGAARVRDLFSNGKRNAPCIIFVDELDAVGRHRGAGLGGGHDEREQTLNQLLIEMDGFESESTVILMAATNRPDVLDPALLRPGRFDRQIVVDLPDIRGREEILKVHVRDKPLADDVDLRRIARGTPFFSGADLANLANEAAILAARYNQTSITQEIFEEARDKVLMGPERRSRQIDEETKRVTAYHEAGHALVSILLPDYDPLHKVTIIPRGLALGLTMPLPEKERLNLDKSYLEKRLAVLMAGRAAEELALGSTTSGAASDINQVTDLARKMVCEWGMSEKLGPLAFGKKQEEIFLGREIAQHRDFSDETARIIDGEVRAVVESAYSRATELIKKNLDKLEAIARALIERETLEGEEVKALVRGEELPPDDRRLPHLREEEKARLEAERTRTPEEKDFAENIGVWPGDERRESSPPLGDDRKSDLE
ncbi:MAG TPA: ATP-dependent zinc metalloprotease FtsH [bacterium]|nr:ATP-dependent zinc metalloprotease FtsH [bacterium]